MQLGDHPLLQPQGELDGTHYVQLARQVAAAGPLALGQAFYVSPLYVYFLAAVFSAGGDLAAARFVQVLLGTTAVGLIYLTARQWYGERAARLAGVFAVLTGLFSFYEVVILQAALDPFLVACALYFISRAQRDGPWWPAPLAGLAAGLLVLNRPNALPWGALAAVLMVLAWGRGPAASQPDGAEDAGGTPPIDGVKGPTQAKAEAGLRSRRATGDSGLVAQRGSRGPTSGDLARPMACAAGLVVVLVGNGVRNYAASGEFVLIASHGGLNFYMGNHAGADGTYQPLPGITPSIVGQARDATREAEAEAGRPLEASAVSDMFYRRAWAWIAAEPGEALRLFVRKLVLVLHSANVPLNYSYAFYSRDEPTILRWLVAGAWLLVPLGMAGLLVPSMRQTRRGFWVWASFVPVYAVSVAAFFVSARYRMPLLVPLCAASGATLVWGFDRLRAREFKKLAVPAACVALAAIATFWPLKVDEGLGGERTRKAVWLVEQGRFEEAERYVASVAPTHSHPGILHYRMAEALSAANRLEAAIEHYRQAIAIDGARPAITLPLGQALVVVGRAAEGVPHLTTAFEAGYRGDVAATWLVRALAMAGERNRALAVIDALSDDIATSRPENASDLGTLALQLEAPDRALRWWRLAAARAAATAETHETLGATLLLLNREGEAVGPLEAACRLDPSNAGAHLNLALALARLGRVDEAIVHAREGQRLAPGEPRATSLLETLTRAKP
jgi:tetratricopeptide (TPR) repeat protein